MFKCMSAEADEDLVLRIAPFPSFHFLSYITHSSVYLYIGIDIIIHMFVEYFSWSTLLPRSGTPG